MNSVKAENNSSKQSVKVSIMQREFMVACYPEEIEGLVEAAAYLDKQMRVIADGSQILGQDRCAIMAGLNISHALLQLQKSVDNQQNATARLESLHERIDKFVSNIEQV